MGIDVARTLLELAAATKGARVVYAVATAPNTVRLEGATTAVELPALSGVISGDYCAVLVQGADRIILGAVGAGAPILDVRDERGSATRIPYIEASTIVQTSGAWGVSTVGFNRTFSASPIVQCINGDLATYSFTPQIAAITTTEFSYGIGTAGINHRLDWIAVGFLPA